MSVEVFDGNDQRYADWIRSNRSGYVVNALRGKSTSDIRLHHAWCATIFEERPVGKTWTEGQYIKICSLDRDELERRLKRDRGIRPKPCGSCNP